MANTQFPVVIYSSGAAVFAGSSSYAAVLESGGNDLIYATSGGIVAETSMGEGTQIIAESGAVISGINVNEEGAVFSGTDVVCSGAEKWYGPAICATFGSIVLSGGTFQNQYLMHRLPARLEACGLTVYHHHRVSCNDEGLSLGQLIIADKKESS